MTDPTPATPDEAVALGHPEARCQSCGGRNVVWHAPNPLWNAAVRRQDGSETFGILCPPCFVSVYEDSTGDRGQVWCLHPHDHEHLSRPAPDGAAALHDVLATAIHGSKSLSHKMRHPRGPEPRCWDEALAVLAFLPDGVRLAVVPEGSSVVSVEDVTSLASHLLPLSRQAPDGAVAVLRGDLYLRLLDYYGSPGHAMDIADQVTAALGPGWSLSRQQGGTVRGITASGRTWWLRWPACSRRPWRRPTRHPPGSSCTPTSTGQASWHVHR
ncbi:MAG: hypothetical protein U0667_17175 [Chloroflexota bacterium]